jgi:predicted signal transduction protein with EAL and GGDEF domain
MERCPHSASLGEAGAAVLAAFAFAGPAAGLAGVEAAVDRADLSLYRASRIARSAASLLMARSPDEL